AAAPTLKTPGTETLGGTVTLTPCAAEWSATEADHAPAPSPASASETVRVAWPPGLRKPKETSVGVAKTFGPFARGRSITPPPSRVAAASAVRDPSADAASPVVTRADLIWATVQ